MKPPRITTRDQAIDPFKLFCAKLDRIRGYSYFKEGIRVRHEWKKDTGTLETLYEGPSDEQIDAVLLHMRFFTIGNEDCSVFYFAECLDQIRPRQELRDSFTKIEAKREAWKKEPSRVGGLTKDELFRALIYGNRVHANDKPVVALYDELLSHVVVASVEPVMLCELIDQHCGFMFGYYAAIQAVLSEI